ncbi:MAG: diphosphate--fructose-6-phosphate 1-phosphotransferase [Candidatus Hydrogenedens sp.]|nr:diphosphate--fructose-6-phosphate 1-phosphotransferase [Candidatus Hydrogenedens sp.]
MPKNVLVAQSGGPSPVINSSLRGVIDGCRAFPGDFGTLYAGWHGIEGVLKEELLDLSAQDEDEIALLRYTPAAGAIGTCRYKLKPAMTEDFDRVLAVLKAHDIGYFFYNGGNDSMDTANKVAKMAHEHGLDLVAVGVPKTIDNDVGDSEFKLIDHTPGYGSVARYWMGVVQNANEENAGSSPADPVLVLQAMGRQIGYIPAAARLADPKREMPLQIYTRESGLGAEALCDNVNDQLKRDGRVIIVVSEGYDMGELGETKDSFGHTQFGASKLTVAQKVVNLLNERGLPVPGAARGQVPGTDQRDTCAYASIVDLDEAYRVGQKAAEIAASGENGWMSTILRDPGLIYSVRYGKVPLEAVANSERTFPEAWLTPNKIDVTDEFLDYARPLIGEDWPSVPVVNGRQRFTRFKPLFADKKLPEYQLQALRK